MLRFAKSDRTLNDDDAHGDVNEATVETGESDADAAALRCLGKWQTRVDAKLAELRSRIDAIGVRIRTLYDEPELMRVRYNLHSVCIHEGHATSGHFWTYIWNKRLLKWFKYNDTEVSESSWDDLYANALGGGGAPTAATTSTTMPASQSGSSPSISSSATATATASAANANVVVGEKVVNKSSDRSAYFLVYTNADDTSLYKGSLFANVSFFLLLYFWCVFFVIDDFLKLQRTASSAPTWRRCCAKTTSGSRVSSARYVSSMCCAT